MGWLRDLMSQAELRSFGDLARKALAHPEWPSDSRAQPRSLEAIFGRLDRKLELDWLADRPGVQQVLAALLNSQVAELRAVIVGTASAKGPVTRLRLDDLPAARSLDLQHEALPPTIPEPVGLPRTWNRLAWFAPSGSGASLAQKWLGARGLAQCADVDSLEAYRDLPVQGPPLFLKVSQEIAASVLDEFAQHQPVCLALTANTPLDTAAFEACGFELVYSPKVASHLERLVDWALGRSPQGTQSRREPLLGWLRAGPESWGLLESMGDVVGFMGLCLAEEPGRMPPLSKDALLRYWLKRRTDALAQERFRDVLSLAQLLPDVLVELAQSACLDDGRALLSPRSLEEWLTLVPAQHRRGPDLDWLSAQVGAASSTLRPRELERMAKQLPPGAHRIVVALRELGLLRPTSANTFALRPHFVARLLQALATERTVSSQPVFWGEALLKPNARGYLLSSLQKRISREPETVAEDLLEVIDGDSAPLVGALESAFVLLGLGILTGGELSEHAAAALLEEQNALCLTEWSTLPRRRTTPLHSPSLEDSEGAFFLAAFALAELSKGHHKTVCPLLDPWNQTTPPAGWGEVLDAIASTIQAAQRERSPWLAGALRLLDRLRQVLGPAAESSAQGICPKHHPLFDAATLLDALELGVVELMEPDSLRSPWQLELFFETAKLRERAMPEVLHALGPVLTSLSTDALTQWLERVPREFWKHAAPEVLAELIRRLDLDESLVPWVDVTPQTWSAWNRLRQSSSSEEESLIPWHHVPSSLGTSAVTACAELSVPICELVWRRWPETALAEIERHRTVRPAVAVKWLKAAPATAMNHLATAATAHDWHKADSRVLTAALERLHDGIRLRLPGWAVAYDCLHRFERERRRY